MTFFRRTLLSAIVTLSCASPALLAEDLHAIYQAALSSDPQLAGAEAAYRAATENTPIARSALRPQINANASVARVDQNFDDMTSPIYNDVDFSRTSYGISLSQALFRKDYWAQLAQANASVAQAEAQLLAARQELILRASQAYFDALTAEDSLSFASAEKQALEQQLAQAQERFDVGLIAITDVREAQAQFDLSVSDEIAAQAQLDTARENLRSIIDFMPASLAPLPNDLELAGPTPANIEEWVRTAEENNLALRAARFGVKAAEEAVEVRRASHYPTLDLNARYGVQDDGAGATAGNITSTSLGLDLVVPLYSGDRTSAQVRQANSQLALAQKGLEQAQRSAIQQVRASYLNVLSSISQVKALQQAVLSTETAAEAAQAGYEVGTRTSVDVLNALRQIYRSKRDYAAARHNYVLNLMRLKQAAGTLTENDLPTTKSAS